MTRRTPTELSWAGGSLVFDALISEAPAYDADVPTAPTEDGYVTLDCTSKPCTLRLEVAVTDGSIYGSARAGRVAAVQDQLLALQRTRELLTVQTARRYTSMLLKSVTWTRDAAPTSQAFTLVLGERRVADVRTVAGLPVATKKKVVPESKDKKTDPAVKAPPKDSLVLRVGDGTVAEHLTAWGVPP